MKVKEFMKESQGYTFKHMIANGEVIRLTKEINENGILIAYAKHMDYEMNFVGKDSKGNYDCSCAVLMSLNEFKQELVKGYGKSGVIQVARLFIIEEGPYKGIWYDNEYVG